MDDERFHRDAHEVLRRVIAAVDALDPDVLEAEATSGVVRLVFGDGGGDFVLSLQPPLRQIWYAGGATAWHFAWDDGRDAWVDRRGGEELFEARSRTIGDRVGIRRRL